MNDPNALWTVDAIQFPRLLSEIYALDLLKTTEDYTRLANAMDLQPVDIVDLLQRAEVSWESIKLCLRDGAL